MTLDDLKKIDLAADSLRSSVVDNPLLNIAFSDVAALALVAAQKADNSVIGSVAEQSWQNAARRLYDLSRDGALYQPVED